MISLVLPFYNESTRLERFYHEVSAFIKAWPGHNIEVICVDDGSSDDTAKKLRALLEQLELKGPKPKLLIHPKNLGKGAALKTGVAASSGEWILTLDADMAASPMQLTKWQNSRAIDFASQTAYFASREDRASQVKDSSIRRLSGRIFNSLIGLICGLKMKDTQCGFKLYPGDLGRKVFKELVELGWAHDVELTLRLLRLHGATIKSLPIHWTQIEGSKINVLKDAPKMLLAAFRIRKRMLNAIQSGVTNH